MPSAGRHPDRLGGVVPQRAPVVPRVRTVAGGAALPLQHHIQGLLRAGAVGIVNLFGQAGSGKTVAVEHIAHLFANEPRLALCDINTSILPKTHPAGMLAIYTSRERATGSRLVALEMADWTDDDFIEYLVATHRQRIQPVMQRIAASPDRDSLGGIPQLWRIVLDALAADDSHADLWDALRSHVGLELPDPATRDDARLFCLSELLRPYNSDLRFTHLGQFDARAGRLLVHRSLQILLGAELLVADLCGNPNSFYLAKQLPRELLSFSAGLAGKLPRALDALREMVRKGPKTAQSNSATILHAMAIGWRPDNGHVPSLMSAHLDGINWPDVDLRGCVAPGASFRGGNLSRAHLDCAKVKAADFSSACIRGAFLDRVEAIEANFTNCDLSGASADGASFIRANLRRAKLDLCNLRGASFRDADLRDAQLKNANLSWADFHGANLEGADYSGANLEMAVLSGQDLGSAEFSGAVFHRAIMNSCNLEYMKLPEPDFRRAKLHGALLTGSVFYSANFRGADLRKTGLADIEWQAADLRDADFTGCSFHAGSTRCGLVGSTIPSEGSKTGFYTDDFADRDFKRPEEIRKASLRGSDLRGAKTDGVDFYLVDLRDARFSRKQGIWFMKCGAIMGG